MMQRYLIAAAVLSVALALPRTVVGQADQQLDVNGTWKGQCFGCAARAFTLELVQTSTELTGTIQTQGTPNFGDDEKPLLNGKITGRKVTFQVRGNPETCSMLN